MSYVVKSAWHPAFHLVGTGDAKLVILVFAGQTNSATTLDLSLTTTGARPYCGAMVTQWSETMAQDGYAMTTKSWTALTYSRV